MDSASAEYMDCRALPSDKARNDDENAQKSPQVDSRINAKNTSEPAKDSRIVTQNAPILNTPQAEANLDSSKSPSDSKILDEKCGLQGKSQGSYLDGNDRSDFSPLPHLSSKAESPQAQKPTPKPSKAESSKPRKALYIDKEALSSLALVQEGLLAPISSLANSKTLHLDSYLTPFVLNPAGKRNRKVLESTKPNDVLDIVFERRKVGYLRVEEVFPIDRHARTIQLTGLQGGAEFDRIYSRLGDLAVCGEYQVDFPDIKEAKARLQEQITAHNAKHITGLVLDGQIFHKAHEALIRDALSMSDLVVLFLLKPYRHTIIHYDMQKECVELAMREYLMSDRICTIPLDDTYLFTGTNNVLLHAMVARNYGCTHFIVSDNTPNLSVFYERNTLYSVLDVVSGISTSIKGGYVYCDVCQMLVNRTTCPHGKHHHISYDTESILEFFKAGLLPPSVLVRPSISAKLIAHLFPNRFSNLQKLYYDLMPLNDGVLVPKSEEDFYLKLMQLYAIHSK
ncbi:sulfate adenylyltransferase [Helicobacter canis]|uniref:Sulfate adenylyltransferase n=2 Tax=Helicobacter canis TaxID=29419 RepID=A0A5M9QN97_9HELI|nr:sulfate adenylyltransferase [Helicobacter canis]